MKKVNLRGLRGDDKMFHVDDFQLLICLMEIHQVKQVLSLIQIRHQSRCKIQNRLKLLRMLRMSMSTLRIAIQDYQDKL